MEADWHGISYLLNEYRIFWMVPPVAVAISNVFTTRQLIFIFSVGSFLYLIGSVSMALAGDPFGIIEYKRDVQNFIGPYLSLGGKFVHGLWAASFVAIYLSIAFNSTSRPRQVLSLAIVIVVIMYSLGVEESRTGYLMLLAVFTCYAATLRWSSRVAMYTLALLVSCIGIFLLDSGVKSQMLISQQSIELLMAGSQAEDTSIGQRFAVWRALITLDNTELLFGIPQSEASVRINEWVSSELIFGEPAKSRNLHSDVAHLILIGGLPAVLIYAWLAASMFNTVRTSSKSKGSIAPLVFGLSVAAFVVVFVSGIFNSTLLDIRERYFVMLILVILFACLRRQRLIDERIL
ncbi:MAG: O-antigen ligase family protein [Gammaproteobacteria bacterium]